MGRPGWRGPAAQALSRLRGFAGRGLLVGIALTLTPASLGAQLIDFRFVGVDMSGGAVWPRDTRVGVVFGGRVGLADLFGRVLHAGWELDWWAAEREGGRVELRDALGGLAVWKSSGKGGVRPYLGFGAALHSLDVSGEGGSGSPDGGTASAGLEGFRPGLSVFAGLAARLTATGAIWLLTEYRYTAVRGVANHQLRLGARLLGS